MGLKSVLSLLNNVAVTGAAVKVDNGGTYSFGVEGTIGGATIDLRMLGPGGTNYILVPGTAMTVAGFISVDLPSGALVKANVAGGAPSALFATLAFIG